MPFSEAFIFVRSEEMCPEWFALPRDDIQSAEDSSHNKANLPDIPYDKMWEDDRIWFPIMLSGKEFQGRCDFHCITKNELDDKPRWVMDRWWFGI